MICIKLAQVIAILKKNSEWTLTPIVRFGYTEAVEGQSIAKLIVFRLLRKLGNSIYQKWGDSQTMTVRNQISKGIWFCMSDQKGFNFVYLITSMMHSNRRLLFDHEDIPKTVHLKHGEIVFWILTFFFLTVVFSRWWWWLWMLKFELFELSQIKFNAITAIMNNFTLWLINDASEGVRFGVFNCRDNKLFI